MPVPLSADTGLVDVHAATQVTRRAPTAVERDDLAFAWAVAKHVKSNAIVFAKDGVTLAIGAGQMSRVDAVRIAVEKAREHGHDLAGDHQSDDAVARAEHRLASSRSAVK
mgnify:CR=1 FL=1